MGIFQQFPYSNFHEMNLDQIIKIMREMQDEWESTKTEWASYKEFIDNYFANLDVSEEVLEAMRLFASDGTLNTILDPTIAASVTEWLVAHIEPTSPAIDNSLSVEGAGADAKVTGVDIRALASGKIPFEIGAYDDVTHNKITTISRIRNISRVLVSDYVSFTLPAGFVGYTLVFDISGNYLGYGSNYTQTINAHSLIGRYPSAYSFDVNIKKSDDTADLTEYLDTVQNDTIFNPESNNLYKLSYGQKIADSTDLDTIKTVGSYYCVSGTSARTLSNCPTSHAFKMFVEYSSGNDGAYITQTIKDISGKEYKRITDNNTFMDWHETVSTLNFKKVLYPELTNAQKTDIYNLITDYTSKRDAFYYDYNSIRDNYSDASTCFTAKADVVALFPDAASVDRTGFFKINCSNYIEMLLMGRDPDDFYTKDDLTYSNAITKVFNYGYYFDFIDRQVCYQKAIRDEQDQVTGLYGYTGVGDEAYSLNTRYSTGNTTGYNNQSWLLYETASDMAMELARKGCEIPMSELQIGDLVFTDPVYYDDSFDYTGYRGIDHVAIVYDIDPLGMPILADSRWTFPSLQSHGYTYLDDFDKLYTQFLLRHAVMFARNPIAFGYGGNVPVEIDVVTP